MTHHISVAILPGLQRERVSRDAAISIGVEKTVDFALTADLLNRAFPKGYRRDSRYLEWQHGLSGEHGSINVAAFKGSDKIGQMSVLRHPFLIGGRHVDLGLIVDFFVLPEHRSGPLTIKLTRGLKAACLGAGISSIFGIPNAASAPVVGRFLKGQKVLSLDVRVGVAGWRGTQDILYSGPANDLDHARLSGLLDPYVAAQVAGRQWTGASLARRLHSPVTRFGLHATDTALLVSAKSLIKGVPMVLLSGFFGREADIRGQVVDRLVSAACRHHTLPLFCYLGLNTTLSKMPGILLSGPFAPSRMTMLAAPVMAGAPEIKLDRYELIDFDIV